MKVKVLYFAQVSEKLGINSEEITFQKEHPTLWDLMDYLVKTYPVLDELSYKIAHNQVLTKENAALSERDEIALLPPFAGG